MGVPSSANTVVPTQSPEFAAEEIDYWAQDRRFVQVLMIVMDEMPLGRRNYWPIYEAAARNGLPVGIHAGSEAGGGTAPQSNQTCYDS